MNCARLEEQLAAGEGWPRRLGPEGLAHLLSCERCRELWLTRGLTADALAPGTRNDRAEPTCAALPALAALHDDTITTGTRSELLRHVSSCTHCMTELAAQLRDLDLLRSAQRDSPPATLEARAVALPLPQPAERPVRSWLLSLAVVTGFALVAVGFGLLIYQPAWRPASDAASSRFRGAMLEAPKLRSPQGAVSASSPLRFAWGDSVAVGGSEPAAGLRYRLVVIEPESGTTVIDEVVSGTSYDLPDDRASDLRTDVRYHWLVESLDGEGGVPSAAVTFWRAEIP